MTELREAAESIRPGDEPWWRAAWRPDWADARAFGIAYVVVVVAFSVVGLLLYRVWGSSNPLVDVDEAVTDWFVERRTDGRTTLATIGAHLADTITKVVVTAIVSGVMIARWKRWRDALLVVLSLTFEAWAFITISFVVGRERPDEQLVSSPVSTTFPSGHVAAATVYGAFAIIVFWHTRAVWARLLSVALTAVVVVVVGVARIYQGMHYLGDVVAGVVLGVVSLVVCARIVGAPDDACSRPFLAASDDGRRPAASDRRSRLDR